MPFYARGRLVGQLGPVRVTRGCTLHAHGSVLIEFGNTQRVLQKIQRHLGRSMRAVFDSRPL